MWQKTKNYYHLIQAVIANLSTNFPSRKLKVIGVTGTDGKTTTTNLIYHILKSASKKASMVSTIGAAIGGRTYDIGFHVTTPSPFGLQRYIKKAVDDNNEYLVLEVTSHALDQYRAWGIEFEIGVLTNITHEHLDYHKTYDRYLDAKVRLLNCSKVAIVNKDDLSYEGIKSKILSSKSQINQKLKIQKFLTYGLNNDSDVNPNIFPFKTKLFGKFNQYNCLAAIATCKSLGVKDDDIREAILTFKAPTGRQEIVYDNNFKVMIDFAHTPAAFKVLLSEVRGETKGRIIHMFGSAGQRDSTKRPIMGEVSSKYVDVIVLTSEDSRGERVEKINNEIKAGIKDKKGLEVYKIPDRKEAIKHAIALAKKGDIVVITGKGHEKSMNLGNGEEPWDEFEAVENAIHKRVS